MFLTAYFGIVFTIPLDANSDKALVFIISVCCFGLGYNACTANFCNIAPKSILVVILMPKHCVYVI